MTIQSRMAQLKANIRPLSLPEQIQLSREERLNPAYRPSRKQIAKLRRMMSELSEDQLAALEGLIEDDGDNS